MFHIFVVGFIVGLSLGLCVCIALLLTRAYQLDRYKKRQQECDQLKAEAARTIAQTGKA